MSFFKSFKTNSTLAIFWLLALVTFCVRASISFSHDLLVGNGGYYPLQVRTVLERGELAFADMPLLFYIDASIVKVISFFGIAISDQLIFNTVQIVDSLSITLLLIPLYKFVKLTKNRQISYFQVIIILYAVLSFYTLNLITTSQKNSLAITFFVFSGYYLVKYLAATEQKKTLLLAILFLLLTGLTHFGTFAFAILFSIIYILFRYRIKALLPILVLIISSLSIIYYFDASRFDRILSIGEELFSKFPNPPQIIKIIIYGFLAFLSIKGLKKYNHHFNNMEKIIIKTLISLLILIPLPIIDPQFSDRLAVFLFIPQVLLLLYFSPYLTRRIKRILSVILSLIILASVTLSLLLSPPEGLSKLAMKDMEQLTELIPQPDKTVIISRHNLEFWVAYKLHVDVAQESKFDSTLMNNYKHVYIINQIKGLREMHLPPQAEKGRSHFEEPLVPEVAILVGTSEYFELYQVK